MTVSKDETPRGRHGLDDAANKLARHGLDDATEKLAQLHDQTTERTDKFVIAGNAGGAVTTLGLITSSIAHQGWFDSSLWWLLFVFLAGLFFMWAKASHQSQVRIVSHLQNLFTRIAMAVPGITGDFSFIDRIRKGVAMQEFAHRAAIACLGFGTIASLVKLNTMSR